MRKRNAVVEKRSTARDDENDEEKEEEETGRIILSFCFECLKGSNTQTTDLQSFLPALIFHWSCL